MVSRGRRVDGWLHFLNSTFRLSNVVCAAVRERPFSGSMITELIVPVAGLPIAVLCRTGTVQLGIQRTLPANPNLLKT